MIILHKKQERYYIGLDIGKTKLAAGIVTAKGKVVASKVVPTNWSNGGMGIFSQSKTLIHELLDKTRIKALGLGIGCFSLVDSNSGVIIATSVKEWKGANIVKIFNEEFRMPVKADHDAHAAAMGEYLFGASKGAGTALYISISSGVSSALISNGNLIHGSHGLVGQIGHIVVDKNKRTVDDIVSGWGISETASRIGRKDGKGDDGYDVAFRFAADRSKTKSVNTEDVFEIANADPTHPYKQVIDDAVRTAALVIALFQNMVDPDVIVLGGSIPYNQRKFVKEIKEEVDRYLSVYMAVMPRGIKLVVAKLGRNNGFMGAAGLLMQGS